MHAKLDRVYVALLAALGLPLGCASDPSNQDVDDSATSTAETSSESVGDGDGDATSTSETGDGDGTPPEPFACADLQTVLQDSGNPSGWVECSNGFKHRAQAVTCDVPFEPGTCAGGCTDCDTGTCETNFDEAGCHCVPGCATDADCPDGTVCVCSGVIPGEPTQCVAAGCAVDGDCGEGLCGLSILSDSAGCGENYSVGCAGPYDCHSTAECDVAPCPSIFMVEEQYECLFTGTGFECAPPDVCNGICGRPFFVGDEARVAPTLARCDWGSAVEPSHLDSLDSPTRARLADYWTEIGQFEHASVASFARFAMQLLQLGAPPQLLLDTHAAMADEVHHAQRAFGLASAYRGAALGPGPLDVRASMSSATNIDAIVEGLIVEACVGETLSALEAVEVATWVEDPAIAATLEQIGEDELRHAALGWRSLRWLLDQGDAQLRAFALERLEAALERLDGAPTAQGLDVELRRFGVVDDALRAEVRSRGIDQLLRPCVAALRDQLEPVTAVAA